MRSVLGALFVVCLSLWGSACASPIVGGECRDGYVNCGGRCVRLEDNFMHCGACDNECSAVQICRAGECVAAMIDGGGGDAGDIDGGSGTSGNDGGGTGGTGGIVLPPDASFPGCSIEETDCDGTCAVLDSDHEHCGTCGNACTRDQVCQAGVCVDVCTDPFTFCPAANGCFDLDNDPKNCGACGRRCMSGLCEDGMCQDAVPGHLIVIGHDYTQSNTTMQRLARSAVFLAEGAPVPALVYQGSASDAAVTRINAVIEASLERTWQADELVNSAQLGTFLNSSVGYKVFVIYPQAGETDTNLLQKLRDDWLRKLAEFLVRGGVVVVFEHNPADRNGGATNRGTHQILGCRNATQPCTPLFAADQVSSLTAGSRILINYEDGWITNGVPAAYAATPSSVTFGGLSTPGNLVATDEASGAPVIVHRLVSAAPEP